MWEVSPIQTVRLQGPDLNAAASPGTSAGSAVLFCSAFLVPDCPVPVLQASSYRFISSRQKFSCRSCVQLIKGSMRYGGELENDCCSIAIKNFMQCYENKESFSLSLFAAVCVTSDTAPFPLGT